MVVSRGETQKEATLLTVALIYLLFGVAGFSLRRVQRLRTLSSVYLAVFALMTPLVALALYRYELQDLHVPAAGVLCISALYATVVYLGLAVQTRFATYAYLGWSALIVATLAFLPWFHHDLQWWAFDLGATTIALLGPHYLRQHPRLGQLAEPATQLAAVATVPAVIGVQALGIIGLWQTLVVGAFPIIQVQPAPLALGACILVPLTAAWRLTVPTWRPNQQNAIIDTIDGFNAVFFAEAVGGVTIWLADLSQSLPLEVVIRPVAISLAFTALAEFGLALALLRWQPHRRGLRTFLEVFSVVLAGGSALIVSGDPAPNWPMVIALSAALVISVGTAIIDGAWWLLVSGFFMLLLYGRIVEIVLTPEQAAANALTLAFVPALATWLGGLTVGFSGRTRRFGGPIYVVALGYALYSLNFFPNHDVGYQTTILLTFMAAAFIAGLREQQPIPGSIVTSFFGLLAVLPFALNDTNGLDISLLALALTAAALAVRRLWCRIWTLAPYAIALWAIVVAAVQTSVGGLRIPDWSASGLPFTAWMLLFFAAVAYGVAIWEEAPLVTAVPAVLAFWALRLVSSDPASVALVFVLIAAGMAARQWRGRGWNIGLLAAAAAGSISVAFLLNNLGVDAPNWQVAFLLALAVAAYLVAAQEGEPALTAIAVVYALVAVALLPGPNNLLPTLVLTFTLVGLGIALHLPTLRARISRQWAFGLYATAIGSSIFATARVVPFDAGKVEGLLLIFAAIAYIVVALEEAPVMTFIPLLYAAASVFVQPDEHALLPLALVFAVLGLLAGRVAGMALGLGILCRCLLGRLKYHHPGRQRHHLPGAQLPYPGAADLCHRRSGVAARRAAGRAAARSAGAGHGSQRPALASVASNAGVCRAGLALRAGRAALGGHSLAARDRRHLVGRRKQHASAGPLARPSLGGRAGASHRWAVRGGRGNAGEHLRAQRLRQLSAANADGCRRAAGSGRGLDSGDTAPTSPGGRAAAALLVPADAVSRRRAGSVRLHLGGALARRG